MNVLCGSVRSIGQRQVRIPAAPAHNMQLSHGFGLKTFDISDPATLDDRLVSHLENFSTYDVIAIPGNENILLVIGDDGFYQFNFDDPNQLVQLSHIPVRGK